MLCKTLRCVTYRTEDKILAGQFATDSSCRELNLFLLSAVVEASCFVRVLSFAWCVARLNVLYYLSRRFREDSATNCMTDDTV